MQNIGINHFAVAADISVLLNLFTCGAGCSRKFFFPLGWADGNDQHQK